MANQLEFEAQRGDAIKTKKKKNKKLTYEMLLT